MAKLIEVIETSEKKGDGKYTPFRTVKRYWSKDGNLLAEFDPSFTVEDVLDTIAEEEDASGKDFSNKCPYMFRLLKRFLED